MTDISIATIEELEAELARRKQIAALPVPFDNPDMESVIERVEEYIFSIGSGDLRDRDDVDDLETLIFEAAVEAVYGSYIWDWVNGIIK